ncbi:DUF6199 family natural product biosynthesis protein [Mycolicibacterium hassiacum]|uniref:DUF6199 family natural product biosynthesis protein n=1 Tax=Mycolicibacterium hassiacum TaxID=46351 RepID=UPI002FDC0D09
MGLIFGGLAAAAPRAMWRATQSWLYRHPEANEPSELGYALSRLGGVVAILVCLFIGSVLILDEQRWEAERKAADEAAAAKAAFVPPAPEDRGLLPVIGYTVDQTRSGYSVEVYYLAPYIASPHMGPCVIREQLSMWPDRRGANVTLRLVWAPEQSFQMSKSDECRPIGTTVKSSLVRLAEPPAPGALTTSGPVARADAELVPAAEGNVIPALDEPPPGARWRSNDATLRGQLPIVNY